MEQANVRNSVTFNKDKNVYPETSAISTSILKLFKLLGSQITDTLTALAEEY